MKPQATTAALIQQLVRSTGTTDAEEAIRFHARALIATYVDAFGEPERPINVDVLASLRGIGRSEEPPLFSEDAELTPDGDGGVTIRVNSDRPETRQRFSVAHEITHTFFPDYTSKTWCRPDSRYRDRENSDDYLEMLCDIGAAELLFPLPWFVADAAKISGAAGLIELAKTYHASREATLRRYVETAPDSVAVVFFGWKLKPTQKGSVGRKDQISLFGTSPEEEIRDAIRLRIDYSIPSPAFRQDGHFLPPDKSVDSCGPIYDAAAQGAPAEDEAFLDLSQASGTYRVWAIPLWTPNDQLGAKGENAVASVLRPISVRKPKPKKGQEGGPTFF